jgi:hypothetical protein
VSKLKREIRFTPAFDKRDDDPKKNYGIHGVEMQWFVTGPLGTIQFIVYTNWQLPHIYKEWDVKPAVDSKFPHLLCRPMPSDLGYHSPKQMYDGQDVMTGSCEWVEGGTCYYDGSSLNAERIFIILVEEGHEAVWKALEEEYDYRLTEGK